ncbi:MAG: ComEC/Rec2 family competence protein [Desulfobacterales bacterium]
MDVYARPLMPLVMAFMAGIFAGLYRPGLGAAVFCGLAAAGGFMGFDLLRRKNPRLAPLLMFLFLGYLSLQPWTAPDFPPRHIVHFTGQQTWRVTGTVTSQPIPRANRQSFLMAVDHLEAAGDLRPATGRLRVTALGTTAGFDRGDRISFEGRLRQPRNFHNPGGFDYERYLAFQKVWATSFCDLDAVVLVDKGPRSGVTYHIDRMRARIRDLIDTTPAGEHRGVLAALLLGDRGQLAPATTAAFQRVGIGHLLAISGLHIGIVAATAFFILTRLLARIPWFLWNAATRKGAALGTFFPVLAYAILAGMSPSTQRALAMVAFFLATILLGRDQDLPNTLAVAALAILVAFPPVFFSASFQLSFAAVAAIIVGVSRLSPAPLPAAAPPTARLIRKATLFALVSVWATLGTLPLTMTYFNQVSLIGIPANCLFVPLIGFFVVPAALLAAFLLPFSPSVAAAVLHPAAAVLAQSLKLVTLAAQLPFAAVRTVTPSLFEIAGYYVLAALLVSLVARRGSPAIVTAGGVDSAADGAVGTVSHIGWTRPVRIALLLVLCATAADLGYWAYQRFGRQDLRATALDVGQGSATLIELPGGDCMLVDGGGYPDNAVFDVGARIVAPLLWHKKIRTIETLVLTHPNSDHLNGLIYIAENFNVQTIWTNGEPADTLGYRRLMAAIDKEGIAHPAFGRLDRQVDIGGVNIEILNPPADFIERRTAEPWRDLNNNSLVVRLTQGAISLLMCGDIAAGAEKELVSTAGDRLKTTVLFVPHHGSKSSSSADFVSAAAPRIGIVSAGWQNRYHFPHATVLKRYRQAKTRLLRTDRDGAVAVVTDGRRLSIRTTLAGRQDDPQRASGLQD